VSSSLRLTARVLPVSDAGEVLLLQDQDPAEPGVLRWGSIGGAVDAGESLVDAALRELREETGIEGTSGALTAFHRFTYEFSWDGADYVADATFFAMPLDRDVDVSFEGLEPAEIGNVVAARWWTASDLERDGTAVAAEMPEIMRAAVRAVRAVRDRVDQGDT
jgi:8-oxo-dGTP pyrophosphatase MutT (NUDIX family)